MMPVGSFRIFVLSGICMYSVISDIKILFRNLWSVEKEVQSESTLDKS